MKMSELLEEELKGMYEAPKFAGSLENQATILEQIEILKAELNSALKLEKNHPELN